MTSSRLTALVLAAVATLGAAALLTTRLKRTPVAVDAGGPDGADRVASLLASGVGRVDAGDLDAAAADFRQAVALDPSEARAVFDVAVVDQQLGRYHDAREGYLHALALDPKLADARFNLALLAHGIGADAEARHDLDALAAIAPNDPRLPGLRKLLGGVDGDR